MPTDQNKRVKLVQEVPDPPQLTPAVLRRVNEEARAWHEAFTRQTASMEVITAEDLKVRAR